uniref:Uncharacterized protein n=1 Tax=Labrus bergylta TaxID=56723 RepID=A0A3Q3EFW7_9LABR
MFFFFLSVLHQTNFFLLLLFFFFGNNKLHSFYFSSIYRYILVKRNMRAFILLENSKFGNFYTIVKTLYFRLKNSTFFMFVSFFKLKKMKRDC